MLAEDVIPIISDDRHPGGWKVKILSFVSSIVMGMIVSSQSLADNSVDGNKLLLSGKTDNTL